MISRRFTWNAFCRHLLFPMSMLLVLSGCNLMGGAKTPSPTATIQSSDTSLVKPFSIANLLKVVPTTVFTCNTASHNFFSANSLVLANDRLIYDQAEVNQITTFIDSKGSDLVGNASNVPSTPPATLKYIAGSAPEQSFGCDLPLTVTNISQETLQIPQLNLRYEDNTKPNTQLYRLINICSIGKRLLDIPDTETQCPTWGAGGGEGYGAKFNIGTGAANTIYSTKPLIYCCQQNQLPAIPTIRPGDVAEFNFEIDAPSGFIVSVVPELVVTSSNKTQTLTLTPLKMDIALAAPQNVSCYALHGTTFVKQDPQMQAGSWCI